VLDRMKHISFNSMGSDFADINNDGFQDLIVLDMLAEDHSRGKENMASMSTENFNAMVNVGYHRQYMANILQLNNGNGDFSDIGQLSGITKTDWSWAPLIADFDNDGFKDLFITNGIEKDLGNQDFRRNIQALNRQNKAMKLEDVLNMLPAEKLPNYIFKNNGDLSFSNKIEDWGLDQPVNSNGAAYADFDNDGDLDLVLNNENDLASIYKNNASGNYLSLKLKGRPENTFAIGSKIKVQTDDFEQIQELYLNRGFQSSVAPVISFGLGNATGVQTVEIEWPDGTFSILKDVGINQQIILDQNSDSGQARPFNQDEKAIIEEVTNVILNTPYKHQENDFNDFSKQLLLPQKQSTQGPCLSVADVNGDGLDDFYVGGASGQPGHLYLQNQAAGFNLKPNDAFNKDAKHEDVGSLYFDADADGDLDLYVTSGGYEFQENDPLLQDRLYTNDGQGNFVRSQGLPLMLSSTKAVKSIDFDNDNDLDLIIGGYVIPGKYPLSPNSYLLENNGGIFTDVTENIAPEFRSLGMISDIEISDYDSNGSLDIIVVGHWMPISLFTLENGVYVRKEVPEFKNTNGWYESISAADLDNDGDIDYVIGNFGKNNKFKPTIEKPLHIFSSDFDMNGSYDIALSKYYKGQLVPVRGKECSSEQTPFLNEKIASYKEFASLNIEGIYGESRIQSANQMQAYKLESLIIKNLGSGKFAIKELPNFAQMGPTLDIEIVDVNKDGILDIIGVGNLYDTEVETIRYDASRGFVLTGDNSDGFKVFNNSGLHCDKDMREIALIRIADQVHIIISSNNDELSFYSLNN
ncbi:MAG: VCBS repeat-containing protein, partial [Bacteroidia bacterium]|nr:VCBS repeat-containing protein [Bacteroidia bacterium]